MINSRIRIVLLCLALPVGLTLGCARQQTGEHPVYPVNGQILYQGKPLEGAYVGFVSETENLPGAFGRTDSQGNFRLTTYQQNDGAVAGAFKVVVRKAKGNGGEEISDPAVGAKIRPQTEIPLKYGSPETSKLAANVTTQGPNNFTFNLD